MNDIVSYTYSELVGFRPLRLDVRMPAVTPGAAAGGEPPVVLWIHGGAWRNGTRAGLPPTLPRLFDLVTSAGFAVVSMDYRLSGEAVYPAQLEDVRAAVRWLRQQAARLGVDADRLAVWGESAGGHLASMYALTAAATEQPRCAVIFYGPSELLTMQEQMPPGTSMNHDDAASPESQLIGGPLRELPDAARAASPITYAHAGAPPMLFLHGDADRLVPAAQSALLADRLRALGASAEFDVVAGADHMFEGHPDPHSLVDRAIAYTQQARR